MGQPIEMCDETVEDVLSQCELKLQKLLHGTNMDTHTARGATKFKQMKDEQEQRMLDKSASDVRVRLNDQDNDGDDDDDDDDFEDEMDEEVLYRRHVKYNAIQIIEKMEKKRKKKGPEVEKK